MLRESHQPEIETATC